MERIVWITKIVEKITALLPPLMGFYGIYYNRMVKREVELACISPKDRVLCIGGGPMPYTALKIARTTGAKVRVVDHDFDAVESARRIVEKLGMGDQVEVLDSDGAKVKAFGFTVVHIALQVAPREEVLNNVWNNSGSNVRVLMRCPRESLKKLYSFQLSKKWRASCSAIEQRGCTVGSTLLLSKDKGLTPNEKTLSITGRRNIGGYASVDSRFQGSGCSLTNY